MDYIKSISDFVCNERSYVYTHYYIKQNGEKHVFYVGKGKGNRATHLKRNLLHQDYVRNLKNIGIEWKIEILEVFGDEAECYKREKELQKHYESLGQAECSVNGYPDKIKNEKLKYKNSNNEIFRTMDECAKSVCGNKSQISKAIKNGSLYRGLYWYKVE